MKKVAFLPPVLFTVAAVAGFAPVGNTGEPGPSKDARVSAEFVDAKQQPVGNVMLTQTPNGVLVEVELRGLPPGWHGFHVHEKADCTAPDFKSAGGHYNPFSRKHGVLVEQGPHAGDMPNIHVGDDGNAKFELVVENLSLRNGKDAIFDSDGSALMVHGKADDYRSQPSGAAGSRIACAEIK